MHIRAFLFFSFLIFTSTSFGQVPGYMGKRMTIGYSNMLCPNYLSFALDYSVNKAVLTHSFNINYIISKQREICLSAKYFNRKINHPSIDPSNYYSEIPDFEKLSVIEFSLGFKRFNKSKFAPLGAYSKWEGQFLKCKMNYKEYLGNDEFATTPVLVTKEGGDFNLNGIGVSYSRGRQRVFSDRFVVDYGIRGTLMVITTSDAKENYEKSLSSDVSSTLNLNPIFNVFIGIGLLAF